MAQVWLVMASLTKVTVTAPPQLSEAVGDAMLTAGKRLAHCTVTGAGQVIIGAVLSAAVYVTTQAF